MSIDTIISTMLNGEPIHDAIVIGTIFVCFIEFYRAIFSGLFGIFKN
jgi:hypothetical protein